MTEHTSLIHTVTAYAHAPGDTTQDLGRCIEALCAHEWAEDGHHVAESVVMDVARYKEHSGHTGLPFTFTNKDAQVLVAAGVKRMQALTVTHLLNPELRVLLFYATRSQDPWAEVKAAEDQGLLPGGMTNRLQKSGKTVNELYDKARKR